MTTTASPLRSAYRRCLAEVTAESERLLSRELQAPHDVFYMASTSGPMNQFYGVVDRWQAMITRLLTELRRRLRYPDEWVNDTRCAFDISGLLRFSVRFNTRHPSDPPHVEEFDLNNREANSDCYAIRNAFQNGRQVPDWSMAKQSMRNRVANQLTALDQIDEVYLVDPNPTGPGMGNNVIVNFNSPLHQSPVNISGHQEVQFNATQTASCALDVLRSELGEVREAILTNQDLVIGVQRTLAATQWDEMLPTLRTILDRMQARNSSSNLTPDEVRALAMRAVNELDLEHALDRNALKHPIVQNLAAAGIWSVLAHLLGAITG